jgi:hypothetical protein
VYLTLATTPTASGAATIGIIIEPLVSWVWVGGGVIVAGSVLAAFPGRRRRPTQPASALLADDEPLDAPSGADDPSRAPQGEPVGSGLSRVRADDVDGLGGPAPAGAPS